MVLWWHGLFSLAQFDQLCEEVLCMMVLSWLLMASFSRPYL